MPSSPGVLHLPQDVMKRKADVIKNHALDCQVCEMLCQCDSYWIQWPVITPTGGWIGLHKPTCILKPVYLLWWCSVTVGCMLYPLPKKWWHLPGNGTRCVSDADPETVIGLVCLLWISRHAVSSSSDTKMEKIKEGMTNLSSTVCTWVWFFTFAKIARRFPQYPEDGSPPEWRRVLSKIKSFGGVTVFLYTCIHMCSLSASVEQWSCLNIIKLHIKPMKCHRMPLVPGTRLVMHAIYLQLQRR